MIWHLPSIHSIHGAEHDRIMAEKLKAREKEEADLREELTGSRKRWKHSNGIHGDKPVQKGAFGKCKRR